MKNEVKEEGSTFEAQCNTWVAGTIREVPKEKCKPGSHAWVIWSSTIDVKVFSLLSKPNDLGLGSLKEFVGSFEPQNVLPP